MALNHDVAGSVGYTTVGTPTVVNGIASGFSGTDYLQPTQEYNTAPDTMEWHFKFNTGTLSSSYSSYLFGFSTHCGIYVQQDGHFRFLFRPVGGGLVQKSTDVVAENDTAYIVHISFNNTMQTTTATITTENGTTLLNETYADTTGSLYGLLFIGMRGSTSSDYVNNHWRGSVDLNSSYIKINGQAWFGVAPVEVKHIKYGNALGYTKTGSPTISYNGIASDFSADDYLQFWYDPFPISGTKTYEVFLKFTTGSDVSGFQGVFGSVDYNGPSFGLRIVAGYRWDVTFPYKKASDGTLGSLDITMNKTIQANTTYYVKIKQDFEAGTNKLSVSTDNVNFTEETITASDYDGAYVRAWRLGIGKVQGNQVFLGSVDLNETYVKLDGKLWFWQPALNYVVKDGKLVFADSSLYIDDNGIKTYASANIAPVPSGYTYGSTTTSDVGYVDMRTQVFTAVPGATIGKD